MDAFITHNQVISDYIKTQESNKNINEWNICIVSNTSEKALLYDDGVVKKPENRLYNSRSCYFI